MDRLLSDRQLDELGRSPRAQLVERCDRSAASGVLELVEGLEAGCNSQIDRYEAWTAALHRFEVERFGSERAIDLVATTRAFFVNYPGVDEVPADRPTSVAAAVATAARGGDGAAALELFDRTAASWLALIDLHRDLISHLLSVIYRREGPDGLADALRYCGERSVLLTMAGAVERPPVDRLRDFVALLHGHFTELRLEEDDEKFTIIQDPCGTCSRQVSSGRYGPPVDLAVVTESHAVTWNRGETTIYRCHIPIWHVELASREVGVPFPVNQCPHGVSDDTCRILLYKNPLDPAAWMQVPKGGE